MAKFPNNPETLIVMAVMTKVNCHVKHNKIKKVGILN